MSSLAMNSVRRTALYRRFEMPCGTSRTTGVQKAIDTFLTMDRKEILLRLLKFESPLDLIQVELSRYPWDSDKEYVRVNNEVMKVTLDKFLANEINAEQLEEWANLIECREDIG